jgi:hypothetical protein
MGLYKLHYYRRYTNSTITEIFRSILIQQNDLIVLRRESKTFTHSKFAVAAEL